MNKKILWGVCGIGNGHIYRQLPLIEKLKENNTIIIFAYDSSLEFFSQRYQNEKNITIISVKVPFLPGVGNQLDFEAGQIAAQNQKIDFFQHNIAAMAKAQKIIGKPDFVITDYEPVSAQYAYAYNSPLITVDQQSKYLISGFESTINNCSIVDEQMRLRLFFPKAQGRFACSFFQVTEKKIEGHTDEQITIIPPNLRKGVIALKREKSTETSIIVYLTSNQDTRQSAQEIAEVWKLFPHIKFTFVTPIGKNISLSKNSNQIFHGDSRFDELLASCHGIITTAGHGLLSEAMFLQIPVYAIPLPLYEQQMNAKIIHDYSFGMMNELVTYEYVQGFINNLQNYVSAIQLDQQGVLVKQTSEDIITSYIVQNIL